MKRVAPVAWRFPVMRPRIQAAASRKTMAAVGRRSQRLVSAKRSMPLGAPSVARWSWLALSRWTTTWVERRSAGVLEERAEAEKAMVGGLASTEQTEVAVMATGPSPGSAVTSATPAGWLRKAVTKRSVRVVWSGAAVILISNPR